MKHTTHCRQIKYKTHDERNLCRSVILVLPQSDREPNYVNFSIASLPPSADESCNNSQFSATF